MGVIDKTATLTDVGVTLQSSDARPNPIDAYVGGRIRLRRTLIGMSQERLGEALGLTFQQVQKYERGVNRVGASRLFDLSRMLDVPISFFYEDVPEPRPAQNDADQSMVASGQPSLQAQDEMEARRTQDEVMNRRETLELIRAYYRIEEPSIRKRVFELIKSIAPTDPPPT